MGMTVAQLGCMMMNEAVPWQQQPINNNPDDILPRKVKEQELFSRCLRNEGLFAIVF